MKTITTSLVFSLSLLTASGASQAALVSEDSGQLVYDTTLNITWLADANLAATNTFGVSDVLLPNGYMTWATTQSWIGAMNTANYLGYNDWRLPSTVQPDSTCATQDSSGSYGLSCTGSEMGQLFYNELGGVAGNDIITSHNTNLALFQNVHSDNYWSGTEYLLNSQAWDFSFSTGSQLANTEDSNLYVWAVRSGNVSAVPLPAAMWLFGSGLVGLISVARRRKAA